MLRFLPRLFSKPNDHMAIKLIEWVQNSQMGHGLFCLSLKKNRNKKSFSRPFVGSDLVTTIKVFDGFSIHVLLTPKI